MKVNRNRLEWYLKNIRTHYTDLTDAELVDKLASWMETNPECIDMDGVSNKGRYYYSTVGYGVMSLLGERYRMGRVEIFDKHREDGYSVDEGSYCMPFIAANQFEDFIEALETDLPIEIKIGSVDKCNRAAAKELGIEPDKMHDTETKKVYYDKKRDVDAVSMGYKDWDDLMSKSKFAKKTI